MAMTVNDLIAELEDLREMGMGEADVRLALQPNYPLEHNIAGVAPLGDEDASGVVYIGEGSQIGYASREIFEQF